MSLLSIIGLTPTYFTVWLGAMLVCLLNLRFGWAMIGIAIPGFLAPLFILHPLGAIIDILQGVVAYFIVRIVTYWGKRFDVLDDFFGQDSFIAIVIASVLVRLFFSGYLLPYLAEFLGANYSYPLDLHFNFSSYGLIISAFIGNYLLQNSIKQEFIPFIATCLLVYGVVRYVFMEYTDFSLANLQSLYSQIDIIFTDGITISYITLIVAAVITIKLSGQYGWNQGSILIAGLLALQWYTPFRYVTTIVEAIIIFLLAKVIMKLPYLAQKNIIGARKIMLFITLDLFYRLICSYIILLLSPEQKLLDWYAFGYLVSILLSIKMYDSNSATKILVMTCITSFMGFIVGLAISLLSITLPKLIIKHNAMPQVQHINYLKLVPKQELYLASFLNSQINTLIYNAKTYFIPPTFDELYAIDKQLLEPLLQINASVVSEEKLLARLSELNGVAHHFNYELLYIKELSTNMPMVILQPRSDAKRTVNWGIYVFNLANEDGYIIETPRPFEEVNTINFSLELFQRDGGRAILINGANSKVDMNNISDVTSKEGKFSMYNLVYQAVHRSKRNAKPTIQVRGYDVNQEALKMLTSDVLVTFSDGANKFEQLSDAQKAITNILDAQLIDYKLANSDEITVGYNVGNIFARQYLDQTSNNALAIIWLGPKIRNAYSDPERDFATQSKYEALDIPIIRLSLDELMNMYPIIYDWQGDRRLEQEIKDFIQTNDIVLLKNILDNNNYKICYLILQDDKKGYLLVFNANEKLLALVKTGENGKIANDNYKIFSPYHVEIKNMHWILFKQGERDAVAE